MTTDLTDESEPDAEHPGSPIDFLPEEERERLQALIDGGDYRAARQQLQRIADDDQRAEAERDAARAAAAALGPDRVLAAMVALSAILFIIIVVRTLGG